MTSEGWAVTYTYETTTSRLKSVTDALGQVKTYSYAEDDLPVGIAYSSTVNPTPNVGFAYDPWFPRLTSMTDGAGTTQYAYVPVGSLGALQLQQESGPLASSAIAYAYDELGRLASRNVQGAGAETFAYDAIDRLVTHTSDLGAFTLGYLGQTGQLTSRTLTGSTLATTWSYLPNSGDRRLSGIDNTGLASGQYSNFTFTTTPENFISGITESSDASAVYPAALTQTATYNTLNQLTDLSGQALTFDADGNLTSDGQRTYTWDAENLPGARRRQHADPQLLRRGRVRAGLARQSPCPACRDSRTPNFEPEYHIRELHQQHYRDERFRVRLPLVSARSH